MKLNFISLTAVVSVLFVALAFYTVGTNKSELEVAKEARLEMDALSKIINKLDSHQVLNASLKGKTVVINLWAGWCAPCMKEIPELNALQTEFAPKGVAFIALSREDKETDEATLAARGLTYQYQKLYKQVKETRLLQQFLLPAEPRAIPLNVIISPSGKLAFYEIGYDENNVQKMREILKEIVG